VPFGSKLIGARPLPDLCRLVYYPM